MSRVRKRNESVLAAPLTSFFAYRSYQGEAHRTPFAFFLDPLNLHEFNHTGTNDRFSSQDQAFASKLWSETALSTLFSSYPSVSLPLLYKLWISCLEQLRNPAHRAIGLNPNIRIYRYTPGQAELPQSFTSLNDTAGQLFRKHYDDSITSDGLTSEWTLLIYLSGLEDGVIGGETVFDLVQGKKTTKEMVVPLNRGTALLHRHGHECMLRKFVGCFSSVR